MSNQYLQVCSEKTLQSNSKGFFLQFAEAVAKKVGEKWINEVFANSTTDKERIRIVYQDPEVKS